MAVPNKPSRGDGNWDVPLNNALDWLDDKIDGLTLGGDTKDLVFTSDEFDTAINLVDKDFTIETTRTNPGQDADINLNAADDVFINANGDDIVLSAAGLVAVNTDDGAHNWTFTTGGVLRFPDGTLQTTAYTSGVIPLASFLEYAEGRAHLPTINANFGWNSLGAWFGPALDGGTSYPVFTSFTIPTNVKSEVSFDVEIDSTCSDAGVCIYVDGTIPEWNYGTNATRIAAQFDCPTIQLQGITTNSVNAGSVPDPGVYRMVLTYDPSLGSDNVTFEVFTTGESPVSVASTSLTETLPTGAYRIGFAADMTDTSPDTRTYISNLSISINNGETLYQDTLQESDSGEPNSLIAPTSIKDAAGNNLITFEKSYTGTARIWAPQDDLAIRSARDILLYAGDDGPGKVYVGWGDDSMNAFPGNEVATKGYVDESIVPPLQASPNMEGAIIASNVTNITLAANDANKFFYIASDENHYWQDVYVPTDSQVNFAIGTVVTFALVDATIRTRESYDEGTATSSNIYGQGQGTAHDYMSFTGTGICQLTKIGSNQWMFTGPSVFQD